MNVITVYGNKMNIQLDMYQTLAIAVVVLILGQFLKSKIDFLEKFCIPAPVVGGLLFAIFTCICYATGLAEFSFDDTLREVCMVFFFTSVGFGKLKSFKKWRKVFNNFPGTCYFTYYFSERFSRWGIKIIRT